MTKARWDRRVPQNPSAQEGKTPDLPPPRGSLKEKLMRLRFQVTYWVWKRMIHTHGDRDRQKEETSCFLDVGCGPGNFVCCLESWFRNADIVALDKSPSLLRYTARRTKRIKLLQGSGEGLPFGD